MAIVFVAGLALTSCKSTKNITVVNPADVVEVPAATTVTETVAAPVKTAPVVLAGDRSENITVVDADASMLKDYNVVVGSFGNKNNAVNYCNKMAQRNYKSFLVQNASGLYRVVAASFDNRAEAVSARDNIRSTYATDDKALCPSAWLLIPTR